MIKVLSKLTTIALLCILFLSCSSTPSHAISGLANLMAQVNSNTLLDSTEMTIRFNLPYDSPPIRITDYIQIYMAYYNDLQAPTSIIGDYAGTPMFSVNNQFIRVTNIRVDPGGSIEIPGISMTNPGDEDLFLVVVMVTEDQAGTLLKNRGEVNATLNYGSVTISASIPHELASLIISGYTAPETFLVFSENASVLGTDLSNPLGQFLKSFSGLQPNTHNITFYGVDSENRATSPIPLTIYTPAFQQTQIANQLLSPTIQIDANQYLQGDDIIASGSAVPGGSITLFTDNPLRSYQASASSDGSWTYTISDSSQYIPGDYRVYSIVQNSFALQSLTSPSVFFAMRTSSSAGTSCGDISQGDLNCDGNIDLTDFSILMFYWGTSNAAADINGDNIVNLTDFSVLMYFWGS